jgi:hypothetical protein
MILKKLLINLNGRNAMNLLRLDRKTIQKELQISENAVNQAMNECPKTTDTELDIHQQNIVKTISDSLTNVRSSMLEKLNELDSTRKNIEIIIGSFSLDEILESTKQKIIHLHAEWHEILNNAKREEGSVYRNYKYFIYQNKLNREAEYPDSSVFHWAFVVLAVLLESIVNSFFFAKASDLGMLGGIFQALFISLSNIGSALLIGIYVLPYKNHVDSKKRFIAKAATIFYIFFVFLFNLATAHYRTLLEEDPLSAGINAIPHLIREPLGINFEAWNLVIIGMLFAIVALLKAYKSDDIYPGFGAVHRKFKSASNQHGKRIEAMRAIKQIIDEGINRAGTLIKDAKWQIKNYKDSIFQSEEVVVEFSKYLESAESSCNNALWEYRDTNKRVRSSQPPAYFSEKYTFSKNLIEIDLTSEKGNCNRIENRLQEIEIREKQKLYDGLREINEKAIEEITGYFESMDKDACKLISWNEEGGD